MYSTKRAGPGNILAHLQRVDANVERLAVQNIGIILGSAPDSHDASELYSFERDVFVHPLIVRELLGWMSDRTESIVAVDLTSANDSNRFFGKFSRATANRRTWIEWKGDDGEWFAYAHIATSPSGIHMVECNDCGGGTGVFGSVGLFSFERDIALGPDTTVAARPRVTVKTFGAIRLGDRYCGEIAYANGVLAIGPAQGSHGFGSGVAKTYRIS